MPQMLQYQFKNHLMHCLYSIRVAQNGVIGLQSGNTAISPSVYLQSSLGQPRLETCFPVLREYQRESYSLVLVYYVSPLYIFIYIFFDIH
jgi:hypothetical protein